VDSAQGARRADQGVREAYQRRRDAEPQDFPPGRNQLGGAADRGAKALWKDHESLL
jgi:hypothetical protein